MSHAGSAKRSPSKYLSLSRRQRIRFWTNRALVLCPRTIVLPPAVVTSDAIGTGSCICEQSTLRPYVFASATIKSTTFWSGKLSPFFSLPPLWASSVSTDPIILGSYQRSGVLRLIAPHELLLFVGKQVSEREMLWRTPLEQNGGALAFIVPKRSEEHTSELQSLMRLSYAVFCLKKKKKP